MTAAFKEWALICEALGTGRQSLIVRKGGIAEGREGFSFRNNEFFLFPTWFHEQLASTKLPPETAVPQQLEDEIEIAFAAAIERTAVLTDLAQVHRLDELHVWRDSVIEERFRYDEAPGVHVAFVRVFRLDPPRRLRMEKKYGGCRSWVELPEIEGCALVSVISDEEHERRRALLEELLGQN
ncbi:MAG: DUF1802 family protein [Chthoniobacterales bacterium]